MRILTFTGGPFAENGYVAVCPATAEAVVVDPGASAPSMVAAMAEQGVRPVAILLTHAHLDHVEGVPRIREAVDAPIHLHPADRRLYDAAPQQAAAFGLVAPELPPPDHELAHGQTFAFGSVALEVRHAPGHAPGHVIFVHEPTSTAVVGDVVFPGSIGRTDLPGGNFRQLMESIREQVLDLPDETRLLTGHGPDTTLGWERENNPFLAPNFGGELV
jgi:hydroxyacylglutathione hydrolase